MRQVKLYIACSLDGYIARPNGDLDWLIHDTTDYGYNEFYDTIDTTISGYNTYEITKSFPEFPYTGKENIVFTKRHINEKHPHIKFIDTDVVRFVKELKSKPGKDIWLVGGGDMIRTFNQNDLIDEHIIFRTSSIIGEGIPLFLPIKKDINLNLIESKSYPSGMTKSVYVKK